MVFSQKSAFNKTNREVDCYSRKLRVSAEIDDLTVIALRTYIMSCRIIYHSRILNPRDPVAAAAIPFKRGRQKGLTPLPPSKSVLRVVDQKRSIIRYDAAAHSV